MPFPNFHSARIKNPALFVSIVVLKTLSNGIMIYGGRLKSDPKGSSQEQAYRFPKAKFTVDQAKKWLKDHDIKYILFEPASEKNKDYGQGLLLLKNDRKAPDRFLILKEGENPLHNDRPVFFDEESARLVIEDFNERGNKMVVDYEHQTMEDDPPIEAPAAGFIKDLVYEPGVGLWGVLDYWTEKARAYIETGEYAYFSPVIAYTAKERHIVYLHNITLTNDPKMNQLIPLAAKRFNTLGDGFFNKLKKGADFMNREELIKLLGLKDDATDEQIKTALTDLANVKTELAKLKKEIADGGGDKAAIQAAKDGLKKFDSILELIGLKDEKEIDAEKILEGVTKLKAKGDNAALSLESLNEDIQALRKTVKEAKGGDIVDEALRDGKTSKEELDRKDGALRTMAKDNPELFENVVLSREKYSVVPLKDLDIDPKPGEKTETEEMKDANKTVGEMMDVDEATREKFADVDDPLSVKSDDDK